ncbi:MAG: hypothetical protein HY355_06800 [Armatimonadetes bacterium]|nr:hypothetical protein [Armatimonadota bacterium]
MVTRTTHLARRPRRGTRAAAVTFLFWAAGVLAIAGALVALDRAWLARHRVDPSDPAVRVAGAVRSISGSTGVRRATYNPATRSARVEVTSRYYDATKSVKENREYLATEARLGAQLALYDNKAVDQVTIALYTRRTLLATVEARQGQAFEQMRVEYSGPLSPE